jgi:hypothetical protein
MAALFTGHPSRWDDPLVDHPQALTWDRCGQTDFPEEPLYGALCQLVARSADWLALMDSAPPTQRRAVLLMALLHDSVLAAQDDAGPTQHPLALWWPGMGEQATAAAGRPLALAQAFHAWGQCEQQALARGLATRRTQTNEVGRSAVLQPALAHLAAQVGGRPLALFDFGCSAGLNLTVDAWQVQARGADGSLWSRGPAHGPLLQTVLRGGAPPTDPFTLAARAGCDLAVVDLHDPAAVRWLRACLWPSDTLRRQRLDTALALARQTQPALHSSAQGLDLLDTWLDGLPAGEQPVLFNSWVLTYLDAAQLAAHRARVSARVQQRGLLWLSAESAQVTQAATGLDLPDAQASDTFWVAVGAGAHAPQARLLARSHPHGAWLDWCAPPAAAG